KIISTNILRLGFEKTILTVISPFFTRIGVLWQTGAITPAHEHFISNLIRQKIIVAIDGQLSASTVAEEKFMLFLPEGELHEITLLFSSYIVKSRNHKVIYLGQNLPFGDLKEVYGVHQPRFLLSVFTSFPQPDNVQEYIYKLSQNFANSTILLSGYQLVGNE